MKLIIASLLAALVFASAGFAAERHGDGRDGGARAGVHVGPAIGGGVHVGPDGAGVGAHVGPFGGHVGVGDGHRHWRRGEFFSVLPYGVVIGDPCWRRELTPFGRWRWVYVCGDDY